MIKIQKDKAGRNAYKYSKFWKLGLHIFINGGDLIFRICYLRNNKGTHYVQLSIKIKDRLYCECGD